MACDPARTTCNGATGIDFRSVEIGSVEPVFDDAPDVLDIDVIETVEPALLLLLAAAEDDDPVVLLEPR